MKYNEIMERVELTDEMRERIIHNISVKQKRKRISMATKWIGTAAACAVIAFGGIKIYSTMQKPQIDKPSTVSENPTGALQAVWEEVKYASMEELSTAIRVEMRDAELPFAVMESRYAVLFGEIAEINYDGKNGEYCYIRIAEGSDDISGDYNEYETVTETEHNGDIITLKGNGDTFNLATWTDSTHFYAVYISQGVAKTEFIQILDSVF